MRGAAQAARAASCGAGRRHSNFEQVGAPSSKRPAGHTAAVERGSARRGRARVGGGGTRCWARGWQSSAGRIPSLCLTACGVAAHRTQVRVGVGVGARVRVRDEQQAEHGRGQLEGRQRQLQLGVPGEGCARGREWGTWLGSGPGARSGSA
eukprot:scaffold8152_cov51-Phaeocystis_antarctica.AAC.2